MCLAIIAYQTHDDWPLIVVANRDEFHARPTQAAQPWPENPTVLAGKDLQAGGSWLGVTQSGQLALLTNYREPGVARPTQTSRGQLVANYLLQTQRDRSQTPQTRQALQAIQTPQTYLDQLSRDAHAFSGFNLVIGDATGLFYATNRAQNPKRFTYHPIEPGVWGLSNALLNTPWPKVVRTQAAVRQYLDQCKADLQAPCPERLAHILRDTTPVPDEALPNTGLPIERERQLATSFIVGDHYGTRCTTVVMAHRSGEIWFEEHTFLPGQIQPSSTVVWRVTQPLLHKGWV